jgi:hypothetical protein
MTQCTNPCRPCKQVTEKHKLLAGCTIPHTISHMSNSQVPPLLPLPPSPPHLSPLPPTHRLCHSQRQQGRHLCARGSPCINLQHQASGTNLAPQPLPLSRQRLSLTHPRGLGAAGRLAEDLRLYCMDLAAAVQVQVQAATCPVQGGTLE